MLRWEEYCKLKGASTLEEQKSLMLECVKKYNAIGEGLMKFLRDEVAAATPFDLATAKFEVESEFSDGVLTAKLCCNGESIWDTQVHSNTRDSLTAELVLNDGKKVRYLGIAIYTDGFDDDLNNPNWREMSIVLTVDSQRKCEVYDEDYGLVGAESSLSYSYDPETDTIDKIVPQRTGRNFSLMGY